MKMITVVRNLNARFVATSVTLMIHMSKTSGSSVRLLKRLDASFEKSNVATVVVEIKERFA